MIKKLKQTYKLAKQLYKYNIFTIPTEKELQENYLINVTFNVEKDTKLRIEGCLWFAVQTSSISISSKENTL